MFSKVINGTPMTTPEANDYFENRIYGSNINRDDTFIATLRALINPRLPENEYLHFSYSRSSYDKSQLEGRSTRDICALVCGDYIGLSNNIHLHNFSNVTDGGESNRAWMDAIENKFETNYPGWHRVEKVTTFYRNVFHALCYINPDLKSTMLLVDLSTNTTPMDIRRMHYLQCGIFAFLPWYFDPSQGVTEDEKELVNSLREKSEEKYLACLAKMASAYDFQTARIKKMLAGFETSYERRQVERIKQDINNVLRYLRDLDEQYATSLRNKRDYENTLLGLETKIAQGGGESEIMDYFLTNKCLYLVNVDDTKLEFVVKSTLDFFDEDMAERSLNNEHSYFYKYARRDGLLTRENLKMLLAEIFLNQRLKIQFCAAYRLQLEGTGLPIKHFSYNAGCMEYTPNPHIDQYGCLGDYSRYINSRLQDHDYIGAIEQCIASCKSLNFGDGTVMDCFMARFTGYRDDDVNLKCIVLPDKSVVTPEDAIKWLLEEKKAKEVHVEEAAADGEDH